MQRNGACAGSSAPILHPRSAACGIIHLTFGFIRADQIVQIPPHRHLGKAGVGGDLLLCHAMPVCWKLQIRWEIPCAAGLVPSSRRCKNNQNKCQTPAPWSRPRPSGAGILPSHPCLLEQRGRAKRICCMAGRTGSSCPQQRKTERSRRGTPCCTYRYRLWLLAGCVLFRDAPCFFTMLHRFLRAASGIRHQHGSGSDAAHPGIVPIFCAGMPCKHARRQCHFPAYCPILSA